MHYALTGHARRQDGRLIVSATLYDTVDVRQVWSQQFDNPDASEGRNAIVQSIYGNVWQTTVDEEAARAKREHPDSLDKRDLMFAALASPLAQPSRANFLARIELIERALALDPNYLLALQFKARNRAGMVVNGLSSDPDADLAVAAKAADQMLLIAPNDLGSLRSKAIVLRAQGHWDEAAAVMSRVIKIQPLESNRRSEYGFILMVLGHSKEALEQFMAARQLAAGSDPVYVIDANIAIALVANDRFPEAIAQSTVGNSGISTRERPHRGIPLVGTDRGGERQWAGSGGARRPEEIPHFPADVAHNSRDPKVPLRRRQPETARRTAPSRDASGVVGGRPTVPTFARTVGVGIVSAASVSLFPCPSIASSGGQAGSLGSRGRLSAGVRTTPPDFLAQGCRQLRKAAVSFH